MVTVKLTLLLGTLYKANGDKFEGKWINDDRGKGIYYYKNGDWYEGDWKDDLRHGKGNI